VQALADAGTYRAVSGRCRWDEALHRARRTLDYSTSNGGTVKR